MMCLLAFLLYITRFSLSLLVQEKLEKKEVLQEGEDTIAIDRTDRKKSVE